MGKKKQRQRRNAVARELLQEMWAKAKSLGAILPEYYPECPDCENGNKVVLGMAGSGLFRCNACGADIVVIFENGEEFSIRYSDVSKGPEGPSVWDKMADAMDKKLKKEAKGKHSVYNPAELVEVGEDTIDDE